MIPFQAAERILVILLQIVEARLFTASQQADQSPEKAAANTSSNPLIMLSAELNTVFIIFQADENTVVIVPPQVDQKFCNPVNTDCAKLEITLNALLKIPET